MQRSLGSIHLDSLPFEALWEFDDVEVDEEAIMHELRSTYAQQFVLKMPTLIKVEDEVKEEPIEDAALAVQVLSGSMLSVGVFVALWQLTATRRHKFWSPRHTIFQSTVRIHGAYLNAYPNFAKTICTTSAQSKWKLAVCY